MSHRFRLRVLWSIVGLTVATVIYVVGFNYYHALHLSRQNVIEKLSAVTHTAAVQLDGDMHERITRSQLKEDSIEMMPEYQLMHRQLREIQQLNNLSNSLFTVVFDSIDQNFHFIVSSGITFYGQVYLHYPEELLRNYYSGGFSDAYPVEQDELLAAFAPIRNQAGKVVGALIADESCKAFTSAAHDELIRQTGLVLTTSLPLVLLLFSYTRNFLREQKKYEQDLKKQQEILVNQSNIIKAQNRKLVKKNQEVELVNAMLESRVKARTQSLLNTTHQLQTYLYRSSHDMRGPVSSILGLAKLMVMENQVEPYADLICESASMLSARIQSLREVYEISTNKFESNEWNLCKVLEEIKSELNEKNLTNYFLCQETQNCNTLTCDKYLLSILMKEIINNCVYHNRFKTEPVRVWIHTEQSSETLNIKITDNGIGMTENIKSHAFRMFFRGHERSQGIGLGLFKVKMIIDRVKGKVNLTSLEGMGTTVSISIPFSNPI